MREVRLNPGWDVPIVKVAFANHRNNKTKGKLVFDTGAAITQVDVDLIGTLGYSARDAIGISSVRGAAGEPVQGYIVRVATLFLFDKELKDVPILVYDFKDYPGVNGLLGWDIIKTLDLDLRGRAGLLKIF